MGGNSSVAKEIKPRPLSQDSFPVWKIDVEQRKRVGRARHVGVNVSS